MTDRHVIPRSISMYRICVRSGFRIQKKSITDDIGLHAFGALMNLKQAAIGGRGAAALEMDFEVTCGRIRCKSEPSWSRASCVWPPRGMPSKASAHGHRAPIR